MNAPSLLTLLVARARAPSNRSKTPPKTTRRPATSQAWAPAATAATQAMRKPMTVSALGDRPSRPRPTAIGVMRPRTRARVSGETSDPLTRRPARRRRRSPRRGRAPAPGGSRTTRTPRGRSCGRSRGPAGARVTSPTSRSLPRCHDTSGCDRPTWAMSSVTVAGPSARRRTIRSRLTSARTLWKRRISRRSSGMSTTDAIVLRIRARDGDTGRATCRSRWAGAVGSTAVHINGD